jgi:hypothetical protein
MEKSVRSIEADGLIWGQCKKENINGDWIFFLLILLAKFLPVAYGVKKLQIGCVVEDDKVNNLEFFFFFYKNISFRSELIFLKKKSVNLKTMFNQLILFHSTKSKKWFRFLLIVIWEYFLFLINEIQELILSVNMKG